MFIGKSVLIKHNGIIQEGIVEQMFMDTVKIKLSDGTFVERNYWEVQRIRKEENE